MKHCSFGYACLVLVLCMGLPVFAQNQKSVETIMIDYFDDPSAVEWTWDTTASRFIEDGYPKLANIPGMPNSLKQLSADKGEGHSVLGVQTSYKRKGDNWFEVYPINADGDNHEIVLKGTVTQLDFWVWGANYEYFLDILVRDADGRVHSLPAGGMNFYGWKNVIIKIPTWLRQHSQLRSGPENMTFVGFHVRSDPAESVDDFMLYFDNFRYTTDTLSHIYDGFELRNTDFDKYANGSGSEGAN